MDRKKVIEQASQEIFLLNLPNNLLTDSLILQMIEDFKKAFVLGAQWADSHPYVEDIIRVEEGNIQDMNPDDD